MNGNRPNSRDQHLFSLGQSYLGSQVSKKSLPGECGLRTNGAQYTIPVFEGTRIGQTVMSGQWEHTTQRHWLKPPYLVEDGPHQHVFGTPSSLSWHNSAPHQLTHSSRYIWSGLVEFGSYSASELSLTLSFRFSQKQSSYPVFPNSWEKHIIAHILKHIIISKGLSLITGFW